MRRTPLLLVAFAFTVACADGQSSNAATVKMAEGQRFFPDVAVIQAGTTVRFVNDSSEAHTVTAYDAAPVYFSSGGLESEDAARDNLADALIGQEGTYEVTFDEPGTYNYFCIPHEDQGMQGRIEVEG